VFIVIRVVLFAIMLGLGLLASHVGLIAPLPAVVAGALAGLAATLAPSFWLDQVRRSRQNQIRRAMPDALDLMGVCLQGGLSLPGSLSRVSQELGTAHPMLALELAIVEREMQMGLTAGQAMRQFASRFDLEELRSLSSVIGQAERFGSSVTQALKTYAEGLRVKRQQQAEEMAQKAAVKILFPTILCIFPGIFIVVLGPAAIRIYQVLLVGTSWGGG
jgi:tight adherence protein C